MINPTTKDYINDLLENNKCLFAFSSALKERIKIYRDKRNELELIAKTDDEYKKVYNLTTKIIICSNAIRINNKEIRDNLKKIEDLRNGFIKEI